MTHFDETSPVKYLERPLQLRKSRGRDVGTRQQREEGAERNCEQGNDKEEELAERWTVKRAIDTDPRVVQNSKNIFIFFRRCRGDGDYRREAIMSSI